jgi:hypothetical protein
MSSWILIVENIRYVNKILLNRNRTTSQVVYVFSNCLADDKYYIIKVDILNVRMENCLNW